VSYFFIRPQFLIWVEEFYSSRYQSGSFPLIDVGSVFSLPAFTFFLVVFHCLRLRFSFFFIWSCELLSQIPLFLLIYSHKVRSPSMIHLKQTLLFLCPSVIYLSKQVRFLCPAVRDQANSVLSVPICYLLKQASRLSMLSRELLKQALLFMPIYKIYYLSVLNSNCVTSWRSEKHFNATSLCSVRHM